MLKLKVTWGTETRILILTLNRQQCNYQLVTSSICELFNQSCLIESVTYTDGDDDVITVSSDAEMQIAFEYYCDSIPKFKVVSDRVDMIRTDLESFINEKFAILQLDAQRKSEYVDSKLLEFRNNISVFQDAIRTDLESFISELFLDKLISVFQEAIGKEASTVKSELHKMKQSMDARNSSDIQKMQNLADDGDSEYMWHLARCFEHGIGVESDLQKAYSYYLKASLFGNIKAKFRTIVMIENGIGVEKDVEKAKKLLESLTKNCGFSEDIKYAAGYYLNCNLHGVEIDFNGDSAHMHLKKDLSNYNKLKIIGAYVNFVKANDIKSLFIKNKENAVIYGNRPGSTPDDYDLAKTHALYLDSYNEFLIENKTNVYPSKGGEPRTPLVNFFNFLTRDDVNLCRPMALVGLAQCYEFGVGVEKNASTAFTYYKQAADLGDIFSCYEVARDLQDGVKIKKDKSEAFKYFKLAADGGNKDAAKMVANLYTIGEGIERDSEAAARYSILGLRT